MVLQVGVKILLQNAAGKFLLVKRSSKKYGQTDGSWDIPGGRIDPGTSLLDNLQREVREETGLEIDPRVKLLAAQDIFTRDGEKHVVRLTYLGKARTEKVTLDTNENTKYGWFSGAELSKQDDLDVYLKEVFEKTAL